MRPQSLKTIARIIGASSNPSDIHAPVSRLWQLVFPPNWKSKSLQILLMFSERWINSAGDKNRTVVLASIPENSAEVTCGSHSHKQVPDEVAVSDSLGEVENYSRAVGEPSGCDPEQSRAILPRVYGAKTGGSRTLPSNPYRDISR
jgi:hypothetical protein